MSLEEIKQCIHHDIQQFLDDREIGYRYIFQFDSSVIVQEQYLLIM